MIKVIAIGDVHGMWAETWRALKAAMVADANYQPTQPVIEGRFHVIFMGDLVHYKDADTYANVAGVESYDLNNPKHLKRAAKAQIRELYRFKDFVDAANGNVTIIYGNHDEDALYHDYGLATRGGLFHDEFNSEKGGIDIPDDLRAWFESFPREVIVHGVQFAHAGPLPAMQFFDDFFYNDRDTKHWWKEKPDLVNQARHRFGVYGHTVMPDGIHIDKENHFAMIDALAQHQYLELFISEDKLNYRVMSFK